MEVRTFSLGAGANTVVFADSKDANGVDTISGFTAGSGGDVLNVKAFLGSAAIVNRTVDTTSSAGTGKVDVDSGKVVVLDGVNSAVTKLKFTNASSTKLVVINPTDKNVYFYTAANSDEVNVSSVLSAANQVATLTGVDTSLLADTNFIGN